MSDTIDREHMSDMVDRAQLEEIEFREIAIAHHVTRPQEQPDDDELGNRHCLNCGDLVPQERIAAYPAAVYCVSCQSRKEPKNGMA
ncbi:TraR/DksA C4-type zinc finger protein [Vibrio harveyi]|nr:TraR/DksA C4-type zinc finger protein [Vibrio harveyi]